MVTAQDGGTRLSREKLTIMHGLRRFIMVDNHEAVKVGDLGKNMESSVAKPKFTTEFPEALVREAAEELTSRAQKNGSHHSWMRTGTPSARLFSRCVEGAEWKTMYHTQFSGTAQSGEKQEILKTRRPRCFGPLEEAKDKKGKFLRSGQCAQNPNMIPRKVGPLGNSLEEPNVCFGRRAEAHGRRISNCALSTSLIQKSPSENRNKNSPGF